MKRYCCVRIDDVCPTMDYKAFFKSIELLKKYGIRPLIGVIPDNKDPDQYYDSEDSNFWGMIRDYQKEGYVIAMHGCNHLYNQESPKTLLCGRKHSEFAGNDYGTQFALIQKGKQILLSHGIETDIFFAPAHTYDRVTLKVLRDNGFKYNADGTSSRPYVLDGITNIPCKFAGVPSRLSGKVNVAVLHPSEWKRPEKAGAYRQLIQFCETNKEYLCSFDALFSVKKTPYFFARIGEVMFKFKNTIRQLLGKTFRGIRHNKG